MIGQTLGHYRVIAKLQRVAWASFIVLMMKRWIVMWL